MKNAKLKMAFILSMLLPMALTSCGKDKGGKGGKTSQSSDPISETSTSVSEELSESESSSVSDESSISEPSCEHTSSGAYQKDENNHWFVCDECGENYNVEPHNYNKRVQSEEYLACAKSCEKAEAYYYSCVCGAKDPSRTFKVGAPLGHNFATEWSTDENNHWHVCLNDDCEEVQDFGPHAYNQKIKNAATLVSEADCENAATYYYSCVCGKIGTETFTDGDSLGHNPATSWSYDATGHWHICKRSGCNEKLDFSAHSLEKNWVGIAGEILPSVNEKCSVCGYTNRYDADDNKMFTFSDVVRPTYFTSGSMKVHDPDGKTVYNYDFPSLSSDLAKDADERIYYIYQVSERNDVAGTVYKFALDRDVDVLERFFSTKYNGDYLYELMGSYYEDENFFTSSWMAVADDNEGLIFYADNAFIVTGRGPCVEGYILSGDVSVGDRVTITTVDGHVLSTYVIYINLDGESVDAASEGDYVGIILRGDTSITQFHRGDLITSKTDNTVSASKLYASLRMYTAVEGGLSAGTISTSNLTDVEMYNANGNIYHVSITNRNGSSLNGGAWEDVEIAINAAGQAIPSYIGQTFTFKYNGEFIAEAFVTAALSSSTTELDFGDGCNTRNGYLDLSDVTENKIFMNQGDTELVFEESDGDAGSYLPSFVYDDVYRLGEEDVEVEVHIFDSNDIYYYSYVYSNYNGQGSITRVNGVTTLTLELADEPAYIPFVDSNGKWNYTATPTLRAEVGIYYNGNLM